MHDIKHVVLRLGLAALIWVAANVGYYLIFSQADSLSYNTSPVPIFFYFLGWSVVVILYFEQHYFGRLLSGKGIWWYAVASIGSSFVVWAMLYVYSLLPHLLGPVFSPYSDILLSTPWYFLPKSVEILLQQVLVVILVLELSDRFGSLSRVIVAYALLFGGMHVAYILLSNMPLPYGIIITFGALLSALLFPFLILRVRAGFVYAYTLHLLFYILLAILLHTWLLPGYYVV